MTSFSKSGNENVSPKIAKLFLLLSLWTLSSKNHSDANGPGGRRREKRGTFNDLMPGWKCTARNCKNKQRKKNFIYSVLAGLRACAKKHTSHAEPIETRVNKQDGTQILQTQTWLSWMMWLRPKIKANIGAPDGSAVNGVLEMVRNAENCYPLFFLARKTHLQRLADKASATGNLKTLVWTPRPSNEGSETAFSHNISQDW